MTTKLPTRIILIAILFFCVHVFPQLTSAQDNSSAAKLARLLECYAKRLQIQEKLTAQIANTLNDELQPRGVAVVIDASHQCMTTRGVHKTGTSMVTSRMLGAFRTDPSTRREFLAFIGLPPATVGSSS